MIMLAALLLAAEPATPPQPPAVSPVAPAAQKPEKEKQICKVDTADTSSRLRKRVCMTQTEWDRKEAGKDYEDLKGMGAH